MPDHFQLPLKSKILTKSTAKLRLLNKELTVLKIYDEEKRADYQLTHDDNGKEVDFTELFEMERRMYVEKYGNIHPTLFKKIEAADPNTILNVMVWLKIKDDEPLKTAYRPNEIHRLSADILRFRKSKLAVIRQVAENIAKDGNIKIARISRTAPVFFAELTKEQVFRLQSNPAVNGLLLHDPVGIEDLVDSMAISNADDVNVSGVTGKGIKVGVWEGGPDDVTSLEIAGFKEVGNRTSNHARLVCGIIKNIEKEKPHGYAPDCKLFSANDKSLDGLEWAVEDQECSVINQSFHREDEQTDAVLSSDDIFKDYMITHYPYPTIVQAAGNKLGDDGRSVGEEYVNHKGFNSLAIGSHNDSASGIAASSIFGNPHSSHGDRELPEISANGVGISAVGRVNQSGTSFASPAVTGSVALLQSLDSVLEIWPEGNRALLLAGATKNVLGGTWNSDRLAGVDARDGSGALNIEESANIAQNRKSRNNLSSRRGWDVGVLDSGDFRKNRNSIASYKIKVPEEGAKHVKVALAWNSKAFDFWFFGWSGLTLDLDLWIFNDANNLVATSSSYDNSYEIAEFDGKPGKEYTIKIRKFSGDDWTYFGIAWTVF